jgi:hypothetical protein
MTIGLAFAVPREKRVIFTFNNQSSTWGKMRERTSNARILTEAKREVEGSY